MFEYLERKRLAKLGFTSSLKDIDADKVDEFLIIDSKLEEMEAEKQKANLKKGNRGHG